MCLFNFRDLQISKKGNLDANFILWLSEPAHLPVTVTKVSENHSESTECKNNKNYEGLNAQW